MIELMKYTYLMEPEKIKEELNSLWTKYKKILLDKDSIWEELNKARAILFLTGQVYCEQIAVDAIERRLHLLKQKLTLLGFLDLIDKESKDLPELRKDDLFSKLEKFYRVIKSYKNKYEKGKYYLEEEKFIEEYNKKNPNKSLKMGYRGKFKK